MAESRLTFKQLGREVGIYIRENRSVMLGFTFLNFLFLIVLAHGLGGISTLWFLLWGLGYYIFSFAFFRYLFKRSPYLWTLKFFDTWSPAIKVMFMVLLGLTVLAYLPYFPLLFGGISDSAKASITGFIDAFMGNSKIYDSFISLVLLLMAPIILYRPLLAWVSAVIGRSGSLKNAFKRTSGCYRLFLGICVCFYVIGWVLFLVDMLLPMRGVLLALTLAPLILLFYLYVAKTFENLFLD